MRPQAGVIKPMPPLVNQLAIKPLEREGIAGVFFRSIRKTDIYPAPVFARVFNGEAFFRWLADELLPLCSPFPAPRSVIIMNNVSVHCNSRIEELITSHGCQISYLPR